MATKITMDGYIEQGIIFDLSVCLSVCLCVCACIPVYTCVHVSVLVFQTQIDGRVELARSKLTETVDR